jgi:hypothetical protein
LVARDDQQHAWILAGDDRAIRLANPERLAQYRAMRREVGAEIEVEITAATTLEFQIAVAPHPRAEVVESLQLRLERTANPAFGSQWCARQSYP